MQSDEMVEEKKVTIKIKGIRDGLLISLGEGEWPVVQEELLQQIMERSAFFQGARVALDVGNHILHAADMGILRDKLSDSGVSLWALLSNSPTTERTSQMLGLATRISTPKPERVIRARSTSLSGDNAMLVKRTLRSGFKVSSAGHVVVIGDVNPGAEVSAGGNVVVWGRLRGSVHAGVDGDKTAVICALEMSPKQLRIDEVIGALPLKPEEHVLPEIALIQGGQIVFQEWKQKERGR
ncbi:MAG: septum site-determining protein MinC [Anaerolineaceae bacterium]|nr:septum site-determining protein MinC [Anaerolineaceae bacterium]